MKKKLIVVFVIFIAIGAGLFYLLTMGDIGVSYETAPVVKTEVAEYVQDTGAVSSKTIHRYYGNSVNEVEEMPLSLGDYVEKGQLLVRYKDSTDLNRDLELAMTDLEIRQVEKQIEALEAAYQEAQSGTDMNLVSSARVETASIQRQIESAEKDYERTEALYNEGIVTIIELEASAETIEALESSLTIAQNTYNQLAKGISDNARQQYEAEIDALLLSIEILEKSKETITEDKVIYAESDGIVTELNTFVGDRPSAGIVMFELQDPSQKVILVDFMVEDALLIHSGYGAAVEDYNLDVHISDLTVERVYPKAFVTLSELAVEENRQTVEIGLPESAEGLAFGIELETKVMIDTPKEVLLVPTGAVIQKDSKTYVKVLVDGAPVEREVVTGMKNGGNTEILDGVTEGEQVILNYQED